MLKSKWGMILIILLSAPILLPVYNPSVELGATGMILGFIGYVISPIIIFGTFLVLLYQAFKYTRN